MIDVQNASDEELKAFHVYWEADRFYLKNNWQMLRISERHMILDELEDLGYNQNHIFMMSHSNYNFAVVAQKRETNFCDYIKFQQEAKTDLNLCALLILRLQDLLDQSVSD